VFWLRYSLPHNFKAEPCDPASECIPFNTENRPVCCAISLRDEFYGGDPRKPDFSAKVIHGDYRGGIIAEYMGFCRVLDEQRAIHKNDPEPQKWIEATIEICREKGFLSQYLNDHKPEVEKIMIEMYNPRYVAEAERKTEIMLAEIAVF